MRSIWSSKTTIFLFLLTSAAIACIEPGYVGYYWDMSTPMKIYIDSSVYNLPHRPGGPGTTPANQVQAAATIWQNYFNNLQYNFSIQVVGTASEANLIVNAADLSATNPHAGAA